MGEEAARLVVKQCRWTDVAVWEKHSPTGPNRYHEFRFRRQCAGVSTFLIAWLGEEPVGSTELLWQGAKESPVRARFPGCPEINGLVVVPEHQSRGIGTALIRTAERLAADRRRHRIGLGASDGNPRAAALYLRLGYQETGCHYLDRYPFIDDQGSVHEMADPSRFLVKRIP
ncbi:MULTISPECIES: GNAT family N-acetyltransferase [Actinoplanes]|uniref:GNAT family N-acetyltransferase n=1 Tax=Actinoplanes TaxID=1865 RepID=UPI0005F2D749|nr:MULTISPECIES: GNAT family N-acetyltransferase [Actinoplanes]